MEIREFSETDEDRIRTLFSACFGKEISHEEWMWKYIDSPWGSNAAVALEGDLVIAHYGGLGSQFSCKGRLFKVFQPCDVMTHPGYRAKFFSKRGVMVKAAEYFYENNPMDFAFGFPSERHAVLGTKQLGYTEHRYVTVLNKKVLVFKQIWPPFLKVETGWKSIDANELDVVWGKARYNQGLSMEKNSRYIFWRYRNNPAQRYEPIIVRSRYKKTPKAFAVFSVRESELSILDFFCLPEMKTEVLFQLLENMAVKRNLKGIKVWVNPNEELSRILIGCGYTPEKGIPYIFKILNKEIDPLFLFEKYSYRMGDYDVS